MQTAALSSASASSSTTTSLPSIGTFINGGYFAGVTIENGQKYANIVAGAAGALSGAWNESRAMVAGATSLTDGLANTKAMAEAGSELAKQTLALTINGFDDWAIPAKDQQELLYRHFKPTTDENYADGIDGVNASSVPAGTAYTDEFPAQTTVENFREGGADALVPGWYWSSTQYASYPGLAWGQYFGVGYQYGCHESSAGQVRAFRRFAI